MAAWISSNSFFVWYAQVNFLYCFHEQWLLGFLKEKLGKNPFTVKDDPKEDAESVDGDEEDMDLFDTVCAICDNGGKLLWYTLHIGSFPIPSFAFSNHTDYSLGVRWFIWISLPLIG